MTILEALNWGEEQIKSTLHEKKFSVHRPKLDAQILLANTLGKPTSFLISNLTEELTPAQEEKFLRLIERRRRHEPVAYLLGEKNFFGRTLTVNHEVLIPRPDTEIMVEESLKLLGLNSLFIDVGTGSGAIAIAVAGEANHPVIATDTSTGALQVAGANAKKHGLEHLISIVQAPLLGPLIEQSFAQVPHLIIAANLPYLPLSYQTMIDPDVVDYEPHEALFAGVDGLDAYDALLTQINEHRNSLPKRIDLLMEIDPGQANSLPRLVASLFPNANVSIVDDLTRRPRVVMATL